MGVSMQVVPHSNGAGDNKRKGGEDGSEPSAKKTRFGAFFCQPCFFVIVKFCQPCFLVIVKFCQPRFLVIVKFFPASFPCNCNW